MRLVSFKHEQRHRFGAVVADTQVVDLTTQVSGCGTLMEVIRADALAEVNQIVARARPDFSLSEIRLLPPIPQPEKIWCIGVNYANRSEEYRDGAAPALYPSLFVRSPRSVVGHDQPVVRPAVSRQLDYEGEIALVIGKGGRRISAVDAHQHIFGLTLCNEGSVRDWLHHGKFNVTQGKNFDKSGSIGPWVMTTDEIDLARPLELATRVNGEVRQHATTAQMIFSFARLIEYLSIFATLSPGDVIVTGTPVGSGGSFTPPKWLVPGDVVEVEVPGIGVLRNTVVDEEP